MKSHVEKSKKYELDKFLIKRIYNIQDKKKRVYNLSKKNIVYDKQLTEQYFKYSNNNRSNYYCSYQSFRDYITSGYNYDFLVNEINNIKSILGFSHSIRELINKKINPEISIRNNSSSNSIQNQIMELNEESNSNEKINVQNEENQNPFANINKNPFNKPRTNENIIRRASTVFQIDKDNPYIKRVADFAHKNVQLGGTYQSNIKNATGKKDFLEICKLLKIKEEEAKNPQNQYQFRLYSALTEEFDPFYLPVYENFVSIKYENQKTKLIKLYNQEKAFIECVTLIKSKLKLHLNKEKKNSNANPNPDIMKQNLNLNIFPQHKFQIKIPSINAFYLGRTETFFKDIDNFMSMYKENTSLASKRLEKDFFENLFKVLTFNNTDCKKFLQYLFSHSYFFKYIYNIFTYQKGTGRSIKNFAPSIKKHNEEEHFLNDSMKQLFFEEDDKNKNSEENKLSKEDLIEKPVKEDEIDIDDLVGNEFIYKINLYEEDIAEYIKNKNINDLKKIFTNNKSFNQNFILTLNNNNNLLQIINLKKNNLKLNKKKKGNLKSKIFLLSVPFDEKVHFYDLEKDIKHMKLDKERNKSEKFVLIGIKPKNEDFSQIYIFKLPKDIYTRFTKSISSKGNKIKKKQLLAETEEEKSDSKVNMDDILNEANIDKESKDNSAKKEIFDFGSNDSEKNIRKNKEEKDGIEKEKKKNIRKNEKKFTFGAGAFFNFKKDNLNESDKNDDDKSDNKDSSDEIKQKSSEEEEDEEKEDDEDNEDEEEEEDSDDDEDEKDENEKKDKDEDDDDEDESDENTEKDEKKNIENNKKKNLKNNENNDKKKGNKDSDEESEIFKKNPNEEEINTDVNKNKEEAKDSDDSDKENDKSNSS